MSPSPRALLPLALLLALSAGCAGSRRAVPVETLLGEREIRQQAFALGRAEVADRLARRVLTRGDRTLDLLVLSGGGQHGAFGAGFLNGWAENPRHPLPSFDAVTGISTGALIAPFAFEGTPEALAEVARLYRNPSAIAPRRDLAGALFRRTGGLFDTSALAATLAEVYGPAMAARLEGGFAEGRQLYIGTTDLDLGRGRTWSLDGEIDATPEGVERFNRILLASSAIPGAFPPVELDGHYHTDGGVATNLLSADLLLFRALGEALQAHDVEGPVTVRLWALVNLYLAPPVRAVDVGSFQAVNARASGLLFALHQQRTVSRMWEIAEAVNAGASGLNIAFRYAAIPDAWALEPGAEALFDEAYMNRLYDYAYERGRSPEPWDALPPGPFE
jgi:hypothetical protein